MAAAIPNESEAGLHVQAARKDQVPRAEAVNLNRIFYKFDEDNSNTLEVEEFLSMFRENYLEVLLDSVDPACQE